MVPFNFPSSYRLTAWQLLEISKIVHEQEEHLVDGMSHCSRFALVEICFN